MENRGTAVICVGLETAPILRVPTRSFLLGLLKEMALEQPHQGREQPAWPGDTGKVPEHEDLGSGGDNSSHGEMICRVSED